MLVQDAMTHDPVTVTGATSIARAARLLARHRVSTLPVVDADGVLVGVVSEVDLVRDVFAPDSRSQLLPPHADQQPVPVSVAEVMTSPAVWVRPSTDVSEVAGLMSTRGFKSLPVVDEQQHVVAVVSRSDLVRARSRADDDVRREVTAVLHEVGQRGWTVEVSRGAATVTGPSDDRERSLAVAAASSVRGVVRVTTRGS